ncbi:iron complex transport system permease protein [Kribbella aluminosa]|uniref:Iron complex transport system permease protein n=1 Tax=Kribbella aluminosa TaxID=416017 RepID=A0ABS4UK57_9ACTN|nr:iron ABC transporter permease [Kribbella aluminosa]MBP2351989.1 iron complex transport system permease protein [Kribbella aluminosa]
MTAIVTTTAPTPQRHQLLGATTRPLGLLLITGLLVVVLLASLTLGSRYIPLQTTVDAFLHHDHTNAEQTVVLTLRVPRTLIGLMAGVALGLAGAVMQGVSRNPLADPGVLGINAGAALAVLIGVFFFGATTLSGYVWFAFAGAGVAVVTVYAIASIGRDGATAIKLALAGTAITAMLGSLTTLVQLMDVRTMDAFRAWSVGSLAGRGADVADAVWPFIVIGSVLALTTSRMLNALALGDDVARALGVRVERSRLICGAAVMILAGAATAAVGPVAFVGLTVPHVARALVGPDYRWILPYSAVLAPLLFLGADILGRLVVAPAELQVGVVTAILGAPVFIAIVRRKQVRSL